MTQMTQMGAEVCWWARRRPQCGRWTGVMARRSHEPGPFSEGSCVRRATTPERSFAAPPGSFTRVTRRSARAIPNHP